MLQAPLINGNGGGSASGQQGKQLIQKSKWDVDVLPAHRWHEHRRLLLLQNPAVKQLLKECSGNLWSERAIVFGIMIAVFATHFAVARFVDECVKSTTSIAIGVCMVLGAATTVGAQCAYLVQALCHECSHGLQTSDSLLFGVGCVLGSSGAALCHVPWAAYYFGGGHVRHHRFAGSRRDVDGDALFWLWEEPRGNPVRRFCWLSVAAMIVPLIYGFSLGYFALRDIRHNIKELSFVTTDLVLTIFMHYQAGVFGAVYLLLSAFFSMGFLCHPLLAFWLLQHKCIGGAQPTVSYYGSRVWNYLCLNELLHVEHHDLMGMSWRHLPKLRSVAPELYGIQAERSILVLIVSWLTDGTDQASWVQWLTGERQDNARWDFGCRAEYLERVKEAELLVARRQAEIFEARQQKRPRS